MAGYSKRSLKDKLGIKSEYSLSVLLPPDNYFELIGMQESDFVPLNKPETDFIHVFVQSRAELQSQLPMAKRCLAKTGMLWVSWPKKSSGVMSDLDDAFVRGAGLAQGLVDVKVAAKTRSGLV